MLTGLSGLSGLSGIVGLPGSESPPPGPTAFFLDTFTDTAQGLTTHSPEIGGWNIYLSDPQLTGTGALQITTFPDITSIFMMESTLEPTFVAVWDFTHTPLWSSNISLFFNYVDEDNHWFISWSPPAVSLYQRVGGASTQRGSTFNHANDVTASSIRITTNEGVNRDTVNVYFNNTLAVTWTAANRPLRDELGMGLVSNVATGDLYLDRVEVSQANIPLAPMSVLIYPNPDSFDVEWDPPTNDGGSPVTGYRVYVNNSLVSTLGLVYTVNLPFATCPPGSQVHARAVNAIGVSGPSNSVYSQNVGTAPQSLAAVVNGANVDITWAYPGSDGGTAIIEYHVYFDGVLFTTVIAMTPSLTASLIDCPIGTLITVSAYNIIGEGPQSAPVEVIPADFDPDQLGGLQVDIDPGDPVNVLLNGGFVEQVNDLSGNARHATQSNASLRGTIRTAELNGYDVLYTALGKSLIIPSSALATWDSANAGSLYMVVKYRAAGDYISLIDTAGRHLSLFVRQTTAQLIYSQIGGGNAGSGPNTGLFTQNGWLIVSLVTPNGGNDNTDVFCNGHWVGRRIAGGSTFTDAVNLGANPSGGGQAGNSDYAQVMLFNTYHNAAQREQVEGYLAHKFNLLSSLPSWHSYKVNPPLDEQPYLLFDTFTDTNNTPLASHVSEYPASTNWTVVSGTWEINTNLAITQATVGAENLAYADLGVADVKIHTTRLCGSSIGGRVLFNYVDINNYWYGWFVNGDMRIYEVSGGTPTIRASGTFSTPAGGDAVLTVLVCKGDDVSWTVKGTTITYSVASRPHKTATKHGLMSFSTSGAGWGSVMDILIEEAP